MNPLCKHYFIALFGCLTIISCGSDEPEISTDIENEKTGDTTNQNKPEEDPQNTETVNLANNNQSVDLSQYVYFAIDSSNNLYCNERYNYNDNNNVGIVDIGEVAGLGSITEIPTEGYNDKAPVILGHGYIVRYKTHSSSESEYAFARIFIDQYLESPYYGLDIVKIKYQNPFDLTIAFSSSSVDFLSTESSTTLRLKYPTSFQIAEKPEWISVINNGQIVQLTADKHYSPNDRAGIVRFSNSLGSVGIEVTQAASESPLFAGGSGTRNDPYHVSSAQQLSDVRQVPYSFFKQTADIDLSTYIGSTGEGWTPIENFSGEFNGQFHKITGLWINRPTSDNIGLFGTINSYNEKYFVDGPAVSRVCLELGSSGIIGHNNTAGICGAVLGRGIECCSVNGKIMGTITVSGITNSIFEDTHTSTDSPGWAFGCRFLGDISVTDSNGIATGIASKSRIYDSYFIGSINSVGDAYAFGAEAYCCYIISEKPLTSSRILLADSYRYSYGWDELTDEQMRLKSTYDGFDFNTTWQISDGSYPTLRCFPD